ncbi:hypothetical protein KEM56_005831 [Ascosphaera pollenicola]|nr:hypothetical protein KEM56_005831 [Ascosphaera pollenicola]
MATWTYPPLPTPRHLEQAQFNTLSRELQWYLASLQQSLSSLRHSLQDCSNLLAPTGHGSTLALSTPHSECVKGYVTRVGTSIVKGDIQLRMDSLPPPPKGTTSTRLLTSTAPTATPLQLNQLSLVRRLISDCLDIVDVSTWTGDSTDAMFISGQLKLLHDNLIEARKALEGGREQGNRAWTEESAHKDSFEPPLPSNLSFHLTIQQAALVLYLRTLEPAKPQNQSSISDFLLKSTLFGYKPPQQHDEVGLEFAFRGQEDAPVNVVEKIRVESQDPNLMSAMAKITAMENEVSRWSFALGEIMGVEVDAD